MLVRAALFGCFTLTALIHPVYVSGECVGFAISTKDVDTYAFQYSAAYMSTHGCNLDHVNASKLYMQGACAATRDNNFGDSAPNCSGSKGGNVMDVSNSTCENVFAKGPHGSFVDLGTLPLGAVFDTGDVCNAAEIGFFFFQTDCPQLQSDEIQLQLMNYGSGYCWNGQNISRGAVAGTAVALFFIIFFIFLAVFYILRRRRQQPALVTQMQPYPAQPYPPQPYEPQPYTERPTSYPQPPPYNPYDNKPATGVPVGGYERFP